MRDVHLFSPHFSRRQVLAGAALAAPLFAQQPADFSTDVKVVNVLATVRNKKGEIVGDLTKDDFSIAEDGRPQTIRYFAREADLPLTLGLLIDTSMSQQHVLNAERGASFRFLDRVMREALDKVFLIQFDMRVRIPKGLTNSRRELDEALSLIDTPSRKELMEYAGRGGTLLFDSVMTACDEIMKKQTGRKAVIVLSDGEDFGSNFSLTDAIESAERSDTIIYSILFTDGGGLAAGLFRGLDGRTVLQRLAAETGGSFFHVTKKQSIDEIFDLVHKDLRNQYNLGYVSDQPARISEFRRIQLTAGEAGLVVQARKRYWARP